MVDAVAQAFGCPIIGLPLIAPLFCAQDHQACARVATGIFGWSDRKQLETMTDQMLIVFGVLVSAIGLFALGRPRADIVAILVVLVLMLTRVLTPQESLAGFGDPVVILIAAIFIVGQALVNTGIAHRLGEVVLKAGGAQRGAADRSHYVTCRRDWCIYELFGHCRHVHPSGPDDRQ